MPNENTNHSTPVLLEGQQPQLGHAPFVQPMEEAHKELWDHALGEFEPYPTYVIEGPMFGGMPLPIVVGAIQPRPLQPLHFSGRRLPPAIEEREKFDLIVETMRAIGGSMIIHFSTWKSYA